MSKETKEEIIAILSEMRSDYNCFDANEEPKYRALSVAIKAINDEPTVSTKGDMIARQILADMADMSVNDDINAISKKLIFGKENNETDKITDESFQHKYPDWYLPKLVCANVNCKYNGFRNSCTCPQVRLNYRHLHTTNEGLVDVYECKNYEIQEDTKRDMTFMELMKFINEATPEEILNYFYGKKEEKNDEDVHDVEKT